MNEFNFDFLSGVSAVRAFGKKGPVVVSSAGLAIFFAPPFDVDFDWNDQIIGFSGIYNDAKMRVMIDGDESEFQEFNKWLGDEDE